MSTENIREKKKQSPFLITSLSKELIIDIITCVPRCNYPTLSLVSKYFRSLVASPELYARRSLLGLTEPYLFVLLDKYESNQPLYWYTLSRKHNMNRLVLIPSLPFHMSCFSSFVAVGSRIYCFDKQDALSIDCLSHTVQSLPSMPMCMEYIVANFIDGKIYVIGGVRTGKIISVYEDIETENWVMVFDTETQMWEHGMTKPYIKFGCVDPFCVVMANKIYFGDSKLNCYVYAPKENRWEIEEDIKLDCEEWEAACVIDDILYYHDYNEHKLRAYDPKKKCWTLVKGVEQYLAKAVHIGYSCATVTYGRKLAVVLHAKGGTMYCAEIALERRQGGEIWGEVEWCDVVLEVEDQCTPYMSLAVMV